LVVILVASVACASGETLESTTSTLGPTTTSPTLAATTTDAATTSTLATTTTTAATTTTLPEFPPPASELTHGGESWAVYLAVADVFTAPELEEAQELADTYGFLAGIGDLACDQGGTEALGLDPNGDWAAVAVYFDGEAEAEQFVDAFEARGHTVAGLGLVETFCLD
jgi:hypothetical protein